MLRYEKCSNLSNELFCYEFKKNNFNQVFVIALVFMLLHAGFYFLEYPTFFQYSDAMETTRNNGGNLQDYILDFQNNLDFEKFVLENNFGGLSTNLYIILNGILSSIYFVSKILFYATDNSALNKIHITFEDLQFKNWVNAEYLILLYLFIHSCLVFGEV